MKKSQRKKAAVQAQMSSPLLRTRCVLLQMEATLLPSLGKQKGAKWDDQDFGFGNCSGSRTSTLNMGLSKCINVLRLKCKTPEVLLVRVDYGSAGALALSANCDEGQARNFVCMAISCEPRLKVTEV